MSRLQFSLLSDEYFVQRNMLLVARKIDRDTAHTVQSISDLTVAEWRILAFTCTVGPSIAAEICAEFDMDPAQASRSIVRLVKAALVVREPGDRHPRRMTIAPTCSGRTLFESLHARQSDYFASLVQDLSSDDCEQLDSLLESVALRVDERRQSLNDRKRAPS